MSNFDDHEWYRFPSRWDFIKDFIKRIEIRYYRFKNRKYYENKK